MKVCKVWHPRQAASTARLIVHMLTARRNLTFKKLRNGQGSVKTKCSLRPQPVGKCGGNSHQTAALWCSKLKQPRSCISSLQEEFMDMDRSDSGWSYAWPCSVTLVDLPISTGFLPCRPPFSELCSIVLSSNCSSPWFPLQMETLYTCPSPPIFSSLTPTPRREGDFVLRLECLVPRNKTVFRVEAALQCYCHMQEAKRAASNRMPPFWAVAAIAILGMNEFLTVLYNPLWLIVVGVLVLFVSTVYKELDVDGRDGSRPLARNHRACPQVCAHSHTGRPQYLSSDAK